jgi:hypothetical protein
MLHTRERQESSVHCDLCVHQMDSTKSFRNKSTTISYLQWKKYASSAKLLKGKTQQQIVAVVAEKLCLHRSMIFLKSSDFCMKTHCF